MDENGWVKGVKCMRRELGEPNKSGRRSPVEKTEWTFSQRLQHSAAN